MIQENLLFIAIGVFVLMLVGLVLTIVELNYGAPKRQIDDRVTGGFSKR
jgi:hypothetical protein